jgi:molecular chaperone GrpE (heat shock protein)
MVTNKLLKLAKILLKLSQVETDKGVLVAEDELVEGIEVFIENEAGELEPAADGEYIAEDKVFVVAEGKIAEIKDEEEPKNEPADEAEAQPEDLAEEDAEKISQLEAQIAELNNIIAEKDEEIGRLKAELEGKNEELRKAQDFANQTPAFRNVEKTVETVSIAEAVQNAYKKA